MTENTPEPQGPTPQEPESKRVVLEFSGRIFEDGTAEWEVIGYDQLPVKNQAIAGYAVSLHVMSIKVRDVYKKASRALRNNDRSGGAK